MSLVRAALAGIVGAVLVTSGLVWVGLSLGPPAPPRWTIVQRTAAHRMLVLDIETHHTEDALEIARTLGAPEQDRFTEILMFFHPPGRRQAARRVQWTRAHGYIEWVYR